MQHENSINLTPPVCVLVFKYLSGSVIGYCYTEIQSIDMLNCELLLKGDNQLAVSYMKAYITSLL